MSRRTASSKGALVTAIIVHAWAFQASAVTLDDCWKMPAEQKAFLKNIDFSCISEGYWCEILLLDSIELAVEQKNVVEYNRTHPYRWREIRSGVAACDGTRQVHVLEERKLGDPPEPHWETGTGENSVFIDDKGQRWRFPNRIWEGGSTFALDTAKPPLQSRNGRLVELYAVYHARGAPDYMGAGMMEETPREKPAQPTPPGPAQGRNPDPCQHSPMLLTCQRGRPPLG